MNHFGPPLRFKIHDISGTITLLKHKLDYARARGDRLAVDLAEAALNDLLDRSDVTDVTRNPNAPKEGISDRGKARR